MIYQITFKKSAIKDLLSLPPEEVRRIIVKIDQLALEPRPKGCKKLQGDNLELWRIRVGDYRVVYSIEDIIRIVEINAIGHRKDIY